MYGTLSHSNNNEVGHECDLNKPKPKPKPKPKKQCEQVKQMRQEH